MGAARRETGRRWRGWRGWRGWGGRCASVCWFLYGYVTAEGDGETRALVAVTGGAEARMARARAWHGQARVRGGGWVDTSRCGESVCSFVRSFDFERASIQSQLLLLPRPCHIAGSGMQISWPRRGGIRNQHGGNAAGETCARVLVFACRGGIYPSAAVIKIPSSAEWQRSILAVSASRHRRSLVYVGMWRFYSVLRMEILSRMCPSSKARGCCCPQTLLRHLDNACLYDISTSSRRISNTRIAAGERAQHAKSGA